MSRRGSGQVCRTPFFYVGLVRKEELLARRPHNDQQLKGSGWGHGCRRQVLMALRSQGRDETSA